MFLLLLPAHAHTPASNPASSPAPVAPPMTAPTPNLDSAIFATTAPAFAPTFAPGHHLFRALPSTPNSTYRLTYLAYALRGCH